MRPSPVREAYDAWSSTYDADANLTRDLDALVTRKLLSGTRCKAVVELGCGTGKNTALLARLGKEVLALDFSPSMIERAQRKVRAPNVTFRVADLSKPWPTHDGHAQLLCCNLVLEHIKDLGPIFAQAKRSLAPQGDFLIVELHPFRQYFGGQAQFTHASKTTLIPAFTHHASEFVKAARAHGLALDRFDEWWHAKDDGKAPRLISFLFKRSA